MDATRLLVHGRVNGVQFRVTTKHMAERLGLVGWVRRDGPHRVELVVNGPQEAIGRLAAWCRAGPKRSLVTKVTAEPVDVDLPEGFEVR